LNVQCIVYHWRGRRDNKIARTPVIFPKMDRRRNAGPEGSVKPLAVKTEEPIIDTETLIRSYDGRFPEQLRALTIRPNVIVSARGSCYLELGRTKLTCAVYGPRGSGKIGKTFLEQGKLCCEIDLLPFSTPNRRTYQRDPEEQEMSKLLQEALEGVVIRDSFPNSIVDVYVNVIEDDGSVLAASITAASVALSLAGIQVFDTLVAVGCATLPSNDSPLIDPSRTEQAGSASHLTMALNANSGEVAQIFLVGPCESALFRESVALATEGCAALYEQIKPVLLS
jgi:exosome complex component MTR3